MDSPEEKIILATIQCIEKYGLENTTIRQIGAEAGVNSAAINYYFRTKDQLMQRVMETTLKNAFDIGNFEHSVGLPIKERLIEVMDGLLQGALQFQNINKAFFLELLHSRSGETAMQKQCSRFLNILKDEIAAAYPNKSTEELIHVLMGIASATFLFPGLFPNFFALSPEVSLTDEQQRRDYVIYIVNTFLEE